MDIVLHFLMENKIDSFGDLNLKKNLKLNYPGKLKLLLYNYLILDFLHNKQTQNLNFIIARLFSAKHS